MPTAHKPPASDIDLWTDDALLDPFALWRQLRDSAAVTYLTGYDLYALPRYEDVRAAAGDWQVFSSARGVALNEPMNQALEGITIHTDPPEHDVLRGVLRRPLAPKELKALEPEIQAEAERLVEHLVNRDGFDAVSDLARHLPLTIVSERVGLPEEGRQNMLEWAFANFNCFGPLNERYEASQEKLGEALSYSFDPTLRERLKPGGWAARLWDAAEAGELPVDKCPMLLPDYWAPSLDTTISATASAIMLFGRHPDQWTLVRQDPGLIPHAVNEVVRLESPIPYFSRVTTRDHEIDGLAIPAGSRVLLMYGAANRDERKWGDNADSFDVTRKPTDHLGFGHGEHVCVGQGLARMEIRALLVELAKRVERFEISRCERDINNTLRTIRRLDVSVVAA